MNKTHEALRRDVLGALGGQTGCVSGLKGVRDDLTGSS